LAVTIHGHHYFIFDFTLLPSQQLAWSLAHEYQDLLYITGDLCDLCGYLCNKPAKEPESPTFCLADSSYAVNRTLAIYMKIQ